MVRSNPSLGHAVSVINHDQIPVQFLIMDCPTESTLPMYLTEFLQHRVTTVVRCCQPTYNHDLLLDYGIDLLDLPFRDGGVPNDTIVSEWVELITKYLTPPFNSSPSTTTTTEGDLTKKPTIAVHCVAGLGRAPVLVAIALVELGMTPLDAIAFIRQKRRGAFNKPQIHFLDLYKRTIGKHKRLLGTNSNRRSSSSTLTTSSSMLSWGGRMMLKLTHRTPSPPSHSPPLQQQQQTV